MTPPDFYDASAPVGAHQPDSATLLGQLGRRSAESDLDAALDSLTDLLDDIAAREQHQPLPEDLVNRLRDLTAAPDAPLAWTSLNRRVREGLTTWETFWARPQHEHDGMRLVHAALDATRTSLHHTLDQRAVSDEPHHPPRQ